MKILNRNFGMATDLQEILRPREVGEALVSHVLDEAVQPGPDFDAMKRLVGGRSKERKPELQDEEA